MTFSETRRTPLIEGIFPAAIREQTISLNDYDQDGISELTRLARPTREHNIVTRARQIWGLRINTASCRVVRVGSGP